MQRENLQALFLRLVFEVVDGVVQGDGPAGGRGVVGDEGLGGQEDEFFHPRGHAGHGVLEAVEVALEVLRHADALAERSEKFDYY